MKFEIVNIENVFKLKYFHIYINVLILVINVNQYCYYYL